MAQITKDMAAARLANVTEEKRFWVNDGRYINNLDELKSAFESMTDDTYAYHCNENKSDFAKWVDECIGDNKLAADLKKSSTRAAAVKAVSVRVKFLKAKTG